MADRSIWARVKDTGGGSPGPWLRFSGTDVDTTTTGFAGGTVLEWDDGTGSVREVTTVAGALWTPAELANLVVWLDANDGGTLTLDGSSEVTQWADKSGNANHFTQVMSAGPVATTLNGVDALNFTAGTALGRASVIAGAGNAFTAFIATGAAGAGSSIASVDGTNTNQHGFRRSGGNAVLRLNSSDFISSVDVSAGGILGLLTPGGDISNGDGSINGTFISTLGISGAASFILEGPCIGAGHSSFTGNAAGVIGEVILCTALLAESNRQKVEGYLAHKWGYAGLLPAPHPYKSAAPLVEA